MIIRTKLKSIYKQTQLQLWIPDNWDIKVSVIDPTHQSIIDIVVISSFFQIIYDTFRCFRSNLIQLLHSYLIKSVIYIFNDYHRKNSCKCFYFRLLQEIQAFLYASVFPDQVFIAKILIFNCSHIPKKCFFFLL